MKSYTDIEQSKKLAEILPLESADGFWGFHTEWGLDGDNWEGYDDYPSAVPYLEYTRKENEWKEEKQDMPCWSLAALLSVLPKYIGGSVLRMDMGENDFNLWFDDLSNIVDEILPDITKDNPVDACYEMILKLNELKLLQL